MRVIQNHLFYILPVILKATVVHLFSDNHDVLGLVSIKFRQTLEIDSGKKCVKLKRP